MRAERSSVVDRIRAFLLAQLTQGTSPARLAFGLALGATLGIFPILGASTPLCLAAGIALRLNQVVLQAVNYCAYPAQLLLLFVFYRAGERLFGAEPVPLADIEELLRRFGEGPVQFLRDYALVGLYGIIVWLLVAPLLLGLGYALLHPPLRRLAAARMRREAWRA